MVIFLFIEGNLEQTVAVIYRYEMLNRHFLFIFSMNNNGCVTSDHNVLIAHEQII